MRKTIVREIVMRDRDRPAAFRHRNARQITNDSELRPRINLFLTLPHSFLVNIVLDA
jgi:hypothetical protein